MQFHDLGPLWVEAEGLPVPLHGRRMEVALAALLVRRGEVARPDFLIECIWGDQPPPTVAAALDTLLWRLRRTLDPDRPSRAPSTVLRTERLGYRLTVPAASTDSGVLAAAAHTVQELQELSDDADPDAVLDATSVTVGLWRGRPYDGIEGSDWLEPTRAELAEHRLTVQRARIGALLNRDAPEQAAAELVVALAENPFDERLWHHRMLGLYRSGRPAAALDAYRDARQLLARELGVEPGPQLRSLHEQILRHDPALLRSGLMPVRTPPRVRIPPRRSALIGRDEDAARLESALRSSRLVTVIGPVGCGKTALAVEVVNRLASGFPDGVFFVDLSDLAQEPLVADRVREALALDPDAGGRSAERAVVEYASTRQLVLVLDNCEQVSGEVARFSAALMSEAPSVRLLATSRQPLAVEAEEVFRLEPLELPRGDTPADLEASPAVRLFLERVGGPVDLGGDDGLEVTRICVATDGLPLSIELAAARARFFQLFEVASSVVRSPIALGPAGDSGPRGAETLRDSIDASYALLSADEQAAHRRLSVLPPGFTLTAATAACEGAIPTERVIGAMTALANHSLLQATGTSRANGPTLFRQLVAIRAHASEQLGYEGDAADARTALSRWVIDLIRAGVRLGDPGQAEWYQRLDDNRRTLVATLEREVEAGPTDELLVATSLLDSYWIDRMHQADGRRIASAAIARLGPGHGPLASAVTRAAYGTLVAVDQRTDEVRALLTAAIADLVAVPPDGRLVAADRLVAMAAWAWAGDDEEVAKAALEAATKLAPELRDDHVDLAIPALRSLLELWTDRPAAHADAAAVLAANEAHDNAFWSLVACAVLSIEALFDGDGDGGLRWTDEILARYERLGTRNIADTLETRGNHYVNAGRYADAVRCYAAARYQNVRIGRRFPRHPPTAAKMAQAEESLPADEFDGSWASGERLGATNLIRDWL